MKENKFKVGDKIRYICQMDEVSGTLTLGKVYEVAGISYDGFPEVINDRGNKSSYMTYRFELVDGNSLDYRIEKAKSLIGKTIKGTNGDIFIPDTWGVDNIYGKHYNNDLNEDGFVVYVESENYISKVDDATIITNLIKLTEDYDALVGKDCVRVGCQNVPIEKVREILAVWENLHG